ncbi:50S ribosomal protein L9 [Streptomyces sp. NBC_01724]|jgi:large subunit ribosomal protein L9|uniref:Large ribosomal subunit protein bL9 n=1 Tax=Streptomyces sp. 900116325 TaxID=3154295 RepID=A0ABV2U7B6_9ACTN|nr:MULTISPECIES: 50S ribosomal protein L9 [unclassified Streptomyces]WSA77840.1 50S ribosomal protein L9 [Streptomyces sp. NBC_01799]WTB32435.1 50S ribosomal protein L9 [Streptomyces sp. NBC_00830]WTC80846.1 50S ribosomal protein L9 [Streptomyces sp. NBC_01653]WTD34565.1 50S ribosomal protein L9 [Streptomyces sp. NBC_01643]WTD90019.1 50S ribosomal protein L9 [Streptomyces sp. NBC_01637]WTE52846.1 50S ribosomal protein L9 [Streptomyces sp. NBC_01620]WTE60939.1 50S ribosomal protein L9 [Strept
MKIILTHEVSGLGTAGDVVDVKDGYARNYLVPRGFAIRWTKGGEKDVAQIRRARKIHEIATIEQANEVKAKLEAVKVRLAVRSGDAGRLFGSVTPADIASAIKAAGGPDVDKRRVELGSPIKTLGGHQVSVRLHPEVAAKLGIEVVAA